MILPQKFVLFGGRGGGEVVAEYLAASQGKYEVLGFLNDDVVRGNRIGQYEIIGKFKDWREQPNEVLFNIPIHKVKLMPERARLIIALGVPDERFGNAIHPAATIATSAELGHGVGIGAHCDIHPGVKIGHHVGMRSGSYIGHDCLIGDFVFIGAHAAVCGYCEIGDGAHIAPNATVLENRKIGRFAIVGAASLVTRDVEDYEIVAGSPARNVGRLE